LDCPRCGGSGTRRLSLLDARDGAVTRPRLLAVVGGDPVPLAELSTRQTPLAALAAPPRKAALTGAGVSALVSAGTGGLVGAALANSLDFGLGVGGLLFIMVFALASISARQFNRDEFPRLLKEWLTQFFCEQCGYVFIPTWATCRSPSEEL
jgi:hypothetical protein